MMKENVEIYSESSIYLFNLLNEGEQSVKSKNSIAKRDLYQKDKYTKGKNSQ